MAGRRVESECFPGGSLIGVGVGIVFCLIAARGWCGDVLTDGEAVCGGLGNGWFFGRSGLWVGGGFLDHLLRWYTWRKMQGWGWVDGFVFFGIAREGFAGMKWAVEISIKIV